MLKKIRGPLKIQELILKKFNPVSHVLTKTSSTIMVPLKGQRQKLRLEDKMVDMYFKFGG